MPRIARLPHSEVGWVTPCGKGQFRSIQAALEHIDLCGLCSLWMLGMKPDNKRLWLRRTV